MPTVELLSEITQQESFSEDYAFYELLNIVVKMGMNALNDLYEYSNILSTILTKNLSIDDHTFKIFKSC